jgi:hypothetical protein
MILHSLLKTILTVCPSGLSLKLSVLDGFAGKRFLATPELSSVRRDGAWPCIRGVFI